MSSTPPQQAQHQHEFQCAICLDEKPVSEEVELPCCGPTVTAQRRRARQQQQQQVENSNNDDAAGASDSTYKSTVRYCTACILTVAAADRENHFRCPTCSQSLAVANHSSSSNRVVVTILQNAATCACCHQLRHIVRENCCSGCLLGIQNPLRYHCKECNAVQRIPHPMYRYMDSPTTWSHETWSCRSCGQFTKWRLHVHDINGVPSFDAPESWGWQDRNLEELRRLRQLDLVNRAIAANADARTLQQRGGGGLQQQQHYSVLQQLNLWFENIPDARSMVDRALAVGFVAWIVYQIAARWWFTSADVASSSSFAAP